MQLKSSLKIGILFTLIILIFIGGYSLFKTLKYNKQVFESNLEVYIPSGTNVVVKVNDGQHLSKLLHFLYSDSIITRFKENLTYPLYLTTHNNKSTILAKTTSQQEDNLKNILESEIFPYHSPITQKYKNVEIFFFSTYDNSFYTCTFLDGVFVGSYHYSEVQFVIDSIDSQKNFFSNQELKAIKTDAKTTYPANIFVINKNETLVLNAEVKNDSIVLNGRINIDKINVSSIPYDSISYQSPFSSTKNAILPSEIYSNNEQIFNNNIKFISSYFTYENNKVRIKIIANKN